MLVDGRDPQPRLVGVRGRVLPVDANEAHRLIRIPSAEVVGLVGTVVAARRAVSSMPMSASVVGVLTAQLIAVLLLAANIVVSPAQGTGPFATALTLSLVLGMYAFVRRIASLLGNKPSEDWDPKRG